MQTKCAFFGGRQIGANCLRRLVQRRIRPELVVPNLDDRGTDTWHESLKRVAGELGLAVLEGTRLKNARLQQRLGELEPEIIFCIGGTQIVPPTLLDIPRLGTVNIHPSLLPRYRGRFSIPHAIFNGERESGVTLHWMDEGIDSGPIVLQSPIPIGADDTARTIYDEFTRLGTLLFDEFVDRWLNGDELAGRAQDEGQATFYPMSLPNGGQIDWQWSGQQINRFIRAMSFPPFAPPTVSIGGRKMLIADREHFLAYQRARQPADALSEAA